MSTRLHVNLRKAPMELEEGTVISHRQKKWVILYSTAWTEMLGYNETWRRQGSIMPIKRRNSLVDLLNTDYYWLVENFED